MMCIYSLFIYLEKIEKINVCLDQREILNRSANTGAELVWTFPPLRASFSPALFCQSVQTPHAASLRYRHEGNGGRGWRK